MALAGTRRKTIYVFLTFREIMALDFSSYEVLLASTLIPSHARWKFYGEGQCPLGVVSGHQINGL